MHLEQFYILSQNVTGKNGYFLKEESHHIHHILRKKPGDIITASDGQGTTYQFEITNFLNGHIHGKILESRRLLREPITETTLACAIIKPDRFDLLVEKTAEIGARRIIPVYTEFGVQSVSDARLSRWKRIAVSALKQSGRSFLPEIDDPKTFKQVLSLISDYHTRYILHAGAEHSVPLKIETPVNPKKSKILILIGPEGGFSENEISLALEYGFQPVSLGSRRLRSETAGIVALSLILYLLGELE